jgi:hypothetical protein
MYLYAWMIDLLIVCVQENSGLRCCFVVTRRHFLLALARYACLGFPLLLRCPSDDVGLGWVGCCAALRLAVVHYLTSLTVIAYR